VIARINANSTNHHYLWQGSVYPTILGNFDADINMLVFFFDSIYVFLTPQEDEVFAYGMKYLDEEYEFDEEVEVEVEVGMPLRQIEENVRFFEDDEVELIQVPVPEFKDSDPADILHDFRMVQKYTHTHTHPVFSHNHHTHNISPTRM